MLIGNQQKIMVNTVPKSGTNLMLQLVSGIPGIRYRENFHEMHKMLPGEVVVGHLQYSEENHRLLGAWGIRQIFVYRDFRDIVVSYAYFIMNKLPEHPLHHFYHRCLNRRFEDLVSCVIEGVQHPQCRYPGLYEELRPFFPWREIPGILILRYEDLVRDQESRFHTCGKILNYLYGNSINEIMKKNIIHMMIRNVNPETSTTFRRGAIGDWKTELNDRQKAVLKKQVGPLLVRWGYEKDENW